MADDKQDKHEKALDLTEAALEALDTGDEAKADKLIDQAKKLDVSAVKEVVADLAEAGEGRRDGHDADGVRRGGSGEAADGPLLTRPRVGARPDGLQAGLIHVGVALGRGQAGVAEQCLDRAQIGAAGQ